MMVLFPNPQKISFRFRLLVMLASFFFIPNLLTQAQEKADKVYDAVEQPAQPKGGMSALQDYIGQNLAYPTLSLRNKTQGVVEVSFIVEKSGIVSNVEVVKGLDDACNKEAVRVIKASPKWEPAKHKGQIVRQRLSLPLNFSIPSQLATPPAQAEKPTETAVDPGFKVISPEESARPEGGLDDFFAYLKQNQQYPAKARKNKVQGKVMVEFMVEKDGSLTNLKVLKKFGNGLDEEAMRLIEKGPKWLPARHEGQPIRQKMILPVIFQL